MSPSFIAEYSKVLSDFPECEAREKIRVGYMVNSDFSVLRLTEWSLIGSNYDYCLTVSFVGDPDADWLQEHAMDLDEQGYSEAEIVHSVRELVGDEQEDDDGIQIARFVYKRFQFRSQKGSHLGVQIKGAFVTPSKEQKGLARRVYNFLLNWHDHVVCDDHQTVYGARIWAVGMLLVGRVQIYDNLNKEFIDVLVEGGIGQNGVKPWDALLLNSEAQLRHWNPMAVSIDPSSQILTIISKEDRHIEVGVTTFDARSTNH
ncbi:TPA: hypothetical protein ACN1CU_000319 [Escherichia coli]|jgi:hypothetical protein|uniref:hypothetical protein n=1 Tax=Escherichia TaxID=561 RepID=UPI000A187597|nr:MULTISPECIES: hypothetical protein [Escherichia]EEY4479970.1 hypothetical protein [Escherichia coli O8]UVY32429.1 MAG: hypothetical protein [Bacteriophage sp.]EER1100827.1 hypothetical protein [Escherichia coli]EET9652671.1 hypothetical protein [Escherichia coli]EEV6034492.1 hypothetical protein [Escherichia coli]